MATRARRLNGKRIEAWLACAKVLAEARTVATHGQWTPFLEAAGIHERTARNMIRIADLKPETVAALGGIRACLDDIERARKFQAESERLRRHVRNARAAADGTNQELRCSLEIFDQAPPEVRARIVAACPEFPRLHAALRAGTRITVDEVIACMELRHA